MKFNIPGNSSKMKELWIELYRFSFSHNTSVKDRNHDKFIGRENTVRKLENLLTNGDNRSGAYLVTGFRGMGKTSLINKTLRRIQGGPNQQNFAQILRAWLFLACMWYLLPFSYYVLSIYEYMGVHAYSIGVLISYKYAIPIALIYPIGYFLTESRDRFSSDANIMPVQHKRFRRFMNSLVDSFNIYRNEEKVNSLTNFLHIILGNILIYIATNMLEDIHFLLSYHRYPDNLRVPLTYLTKNFIIAHFILWYANNIIDKIYFTMHVSSDRRIFHRRHARNNYHFRRCMAPVIICALLLLSSHFWQAKTIAVFGPPLFILICIVTIIKMNGLLQKGVVEKGIKTGERGVRNRIRQIYNYGDYCTVQINLGQDDLKELDVLRLLTNATLTRYKKWYYSLWSFKKFIWTTIIVIGLSTITVCLSNNDSSLGMLYEIRNKSGILNYFPSQVITLKKKISDTEELYSKLNNGKKDLPPIPTGGESLITIDGKIREARYVASDSATNVIPDKIYIKEVTQEIKASKKVFRGSCIIVDHFMAASYEWLSKSLVFFLSDTLGFIHWDSLIPKRLDYLNIMLLIMYYIIYRIAIRVLPVFGIKTNYSSICLLKRIAVNIDANITQTYERNFLIKSFGGFSFGKQQQQPKLDAKDIENRLINFFDQLENIPGLFVKPKFIYVFDELDKIEPLANSILNDKLKEDIIDDNSAKVEGMRARQQVIARILANLKFFLNTAKAKFIFIAGREMYDASLADVSDRDSSIGSIFHDVVYVESFYTDWDEGKTSNVMELTEQYVCQFLIPSEYFVPKPVNLNAYNEFLENECTINGKKISNNLRAKIIITIHNFITYLVYRSNGSPKKVASIFEDFVRFPLDSDLRKSTNIVRGEHLSEPYLYFGPDEQYKCGLTTYLFTPFLMTVSHHFHELGDKLLVSTTYLMDHLYKFHSYGFSWRNLELTPEIIAINKDPELREFITGLISFLSKNHIRHILSGLHEYKFNKKLSAEIQFVSKISELESAAFNFTLDESLEVKRYYRKRLLELKNSYGAEYYKNGKHVHSISFVQMILGDLHYYDQEYDDAIIHYMEAIQIIRNQEKDQSTPYNFVLLMRNMLKLGLVFEHKKTYESAFMVYSQLSTMVVRIRDIDLNSIDLEVFFVNKPELQNFLDRHYDLIIKQPGVPTLLQNNINEHKSAIIHWMDKEKFGTKNSPRETIRIIGRHFDINKKEGIKPNKGKIMSWQEMDSFVGFEEDFFDKTLRDEWFSTDKAEIYQNISLQEGLRLFFQPIIAKLQVLEKHSITGITQIDMDRADEEFKFIFRSVKYHEKYAVGVEYYNKTADVLYYKNGLLKDNCNKLNDLESPLPPKDFRIPDDAYRRYMYSLYENLARGLNEEPREGASIEEQEHWVLTKINQHIIVEYRQHFNNATYNYLDACASGMSDVAKLSYQYVKQRA